MLRRRWSYDTKCEDHNNYVSIFISIFWNLKTMSFERPSIIAKRAPWMHYTEKPESKRKVHNIHSLRLPFFGLFGRYHIWNASSPRHNLWLKSFLQIRAFSPKHFFRWETASRYSEQRSQTPIYCSGNRFSFQLKENTAYGHITRNASLNIIFFQCYHLP